MVCFLFDTGLKRADLFDLVGLNFAAVALQIQFIRCSRPCKDVMRTAYAQAKTQMLQQIASGAKGNIAIRSP
jgi:hypothetical protein